MSKLEPIRGVRGMNDVLPVDEAIWQRLEDAVAGVMRAYGFQRIRTPIVESTRLFVRGIGEVTDIVEKEMYSFTDSLNGERLTLRPESTASVVRAVNEHNLLYTGPKKLWYAGPMFRHERPQKGRYRQFHQVGAEAMGLAGPESDAELILLCARLWAELELPPVRLEINTLGSADERRLHRDALITYLESHQDQLDEDALRRLHSNPLRILDTKNRAMQALVDAAPKLIDFLGDASRAHFESLQTLLRSQNQPFVVNPRLVRGLDYYNLTVFEWVAADGMAVCGGGRYDPLIAMLGGKDAPASGFAMGVERVLDLMRSAEQDRVAAPLCDVYVVHNGGIDSDRVALNLAERLRDAGIDVMCHAGGGSFKTQFKRADASGAMLAMVLGDDEMARGEVSIKWLRTDIADAEPQQIRVPIAESVDRVISAMLAQEEDDDIADLDNADEDEDRDLDDHAPSTMTRH